MIRKARKVAEEQISPSLKSSENTLTHQWKTFSHPSNYPDFFFFKFSSLSLGMKSRALKKYLRKKGGGEGRIKLHAAYSGFSVRVLMKQ